MDNHYQQVKAVAAAAAAAAAGAAAAAVAAVVNTLLEDNSEGDEGSEGGERGIIHPGGIPYAAAIAGHFLMGSEVQFVNQFRMGKSDFFQLAKWIRDNGHLEDTINQSVEQKLMVFLYVAGQGTTQRDTSHFFQISQSSVSNIVQLVLTALVILHDEVVRQPGLEYVSPAIELSEKDYCFTGCIGAVDGTLVAAHIPLQHQKRFYNRKGYVSQNVLAAVRFDGLFSYVLAGGEGSINDAALGDAGFACDGGIVTPFPGERYHLKEFAEAGKRPETAKELYNVYHSRLRVVVEKAFGRLKRRWKILRSAVPEYTYADQIRFIYATTALYNFMLMDKEGDDWDTNDEKEVLQRAAQQADVIVGGKVAKEIRHNTAIEAWQNRAVYLEGLL